MGMERWYVAVVDGCRLLERALDDPAFGEYLGIPNHFGRERWRNSRHGLHSEFLAEVDEMNRSHPGIETRIYTLDRSFDELHYLLSEGRRRGRFDTMDWGTKAIIGSTSLPDHLIGLQGHKIRYSPPTDVHEVVARLGELTPEGIRSVYSPEDMERQRVYKFWADRANEEEWCRTVGYIRGLRAFYADASSNNEGVLTVVT